ncbi:potassium channel family protein, partial [Actinacidiphila rubida]
MADLTDSEVGEGEARARVRMPYRVHGPVRTIASRMAVAVGLIVVAACVVYVGRDGYSDSTGQPVGWLTSFYYAVVTLTTIGYGDVVPVSGEARLINTLVITPLRLGFLLVLVGTTFRALTERTRHEWHEQSWRRKVHDHTVVIGYGTTGRAA